MFDYSCKLIFKFIFGSHVLLGIDSQLIIATLLAPEILLGVNFALQKIAGIHFECCFAVELLIQGLSYGVHEIVLIDDWSEMCAHCDL